MTADELSRLREAGVTGVLQITGDHWPQAQSILFAGGGFRHGQVIGSTNDKAEIPTSRKVGVEDFCATVYHSLGLRTDDSINDLSGRPVHLVPGGEVPSEMI